MTKVKPDIRVKRIYDPPEQSDGARVLVDRLWPRGVRKDEATIDLWLKEVGPSDELRHWFGHDPARFPEFSRRYRVELDANGEAVDRLEEFVKAGRVTLIYSAHDAEHNQARVLADYLETRHGA